MNLFSLYQTLFFLYGPQGWWPLVSLENKFDSNPTKTGSLRGYHPGDYSYPKNKKEQFEIIAGALLTQNTSWLQVEKALLNLKALHALDPKKLLGLDDDALKDSIKPAGYFNQKSERLKLLAEWFLSLKGVPTRNELLSLKGIGPETADAILLYAFKQPEFVIDAYTKRILVGLKLVSSKATYHEMKALFENVLDPDYQLFQEYHALLVEHAKRYYSGKETALDPLLKKQT